MRETDVIVIGAGLHGCSAALQLALRGQAVLLLERRHVARHASGINAGGVRTLWRDPAELPLAIAGMAHWPHLTDIVGDDCGFVACGQVKVAETPGEFEHLEKRAAHLQSLGYRHEELVGSAALRRLIPALAGHCVGGLLVRGDGRADPYRTTKAFAARAQRAGVCLIEGEAVLGLEPVPGGWEVTGTSARYRARCVVNAAGAWAADIARMAGDAFPLSPRASMILVTERLRRFVDPVVSAVGRRLSFKQMTNGTVLVGGGQQGRPDLVRELGTVDQRNLAHAAKAAVALFPGMADSRIVRSWCGLEAETPDRLPVIDRSPRRSGLVHVFGFSGHGFQLGPICGSAVADLVLLGRSELPISPFGSRRFSTQEVPCSI